MQSLFQNQSSASESSDDNPEDGITIKVEAGQEVRFEVSAAGSKKSYKGH